jgi:hypothetical protein
MNHLLYYLLIYILSDPLGVNRLPYTSTTLATTTNRLAAVWDLLSFYKDIPTSGNESRVFCLFLIIDCTQNSLDFK